MRTRKPQPTEKLATVELEKLIEISHRAGVAAPVVERDEVEIIHQAEPAPPKKFADSSGVGAATEPAQLHSNEMAVPVVIEDDDDLAIPVEAAPVAAAVAEPRPSRRLWWLTLLVALVASGVIALRLFGL